VQKAQQSAAATSGATSGNRVAAYLRGDADAKPATDKLLERLTLPTPAPKEEPSPVAALVEKPDEAKLEALTRPAESVAPEATASTAPEPAQPVDLSKANEKLSALLGKPK
jgi:hypothetical protein